MRPSEDQSDQPVGLSTSEAESSTVNLATPLGESEHLVRPRSGDYIHRSSCRHATALGTVRWRWADENPDEDWRVTAPWLKACKRCDPPSPARPKREGPTRV